MALDDIYRVTHVQQYGLGGPEILNVYYYIQATAGVEEGAEQLAFAWIGGMSSAIQAIQSDNIRWQELRVENIVPSPDFFTQPFTPVTDGGTRPGNCLPAFNNYSFRLNRTTSAVRNGQKRICGVAEPDQNNGVVEPGMAPALNTLATQLSAVLGGPPPANATYQPVIFRAGAPAKTIPAKTIPAKLQASFTFGSSQYVKISHQTSREGI